MEATPRAPRPAPVAPERSRGRDRRHAAGLVLPWALVVVLWWRVLAPDGPGALWPAGLLVAGCAALTVLVTLGWIAHNLAIHRVRGPRRGLPDATFGYERDWKGRQVVADWPAVRTAGVVFVSGVDQRKVFVPGFARAGRLPARRDTGRPPRSWPHGR